MTCLTRIQGMKNRLPKNDFEEGFDHAIRVLMYLLWSASPEWARARRSFATWKPKLRRRPKMIRRAK